jgi:hypothetical protein
MALLMTVELYSMAGKSDSSDGRGDETEGREGRSGRVLGKVIEKLERKVFGEGGERRGRQIGLSHDVMNFERPHHRLSQSTLRRRRHAELCHVPTY